MVVDSDDWEGPGGWNDDPRSGYTPAQRRFFAWQEHYGLSHAHAWTVASECLAARARQFGANPEQIHILHNGIDAAPTSPGPRSPEPVTAVLYTRFAGVRPAHVVALWAQVRALRPDAHLIVLGRGMAGEEAALAGVEGITVRGWVEPPHLPAALAAASVAIAPWADTPSNRARHSAKILELMAAGLPVVAYAVGELPATLGDAGALLPPGDSAAFARTVVELWADPARAARLAVAARARVAALFSWEVLAVRALRAYGEVHANDGA
jgi:glycosyltransferase involved in cell wall biosynthesis